VHIRFPRGKYGQSRTRDTCVTVGGEAAFFLTITNFRKTLKNLRVSSRVK